MWCNIILTCPLPMECRNPNICHSVGVHKSGSDAFRLTTVPLEYPSREKEENVPRFGLSIAPIRYTDPSLVWRISEWIELQKELGFSKARFLTSVWYLFVFSLRRLDKDEHFAPNRKRKMSRRSTRAETAKMDNIFFHRL